MFKDKTSIRGTIKKFRTGLVTSVIAFVGVSTLSTRAYAEEILTNSETLVESQGSLEELTQELPLEQQLEATNQAITETQAQIATQEQVIVTDNQALTNAVAQNTIATSNLERVTEQVETATLEADNLAQEVQTLENQVETLQNQSAETVTESIVSDFGGYATPEIIEKSMQAPGFRPDGVLTDEALSTSDENYQFTLRNIQPADGTYETVVELSEEQAKDWQETGKITIDRSKLTFNPQKVAEEIINLVYQLRKDNGLDDIAPELRPDIKIDQNYMKFAQFRAEENVIQGVTHATEFSKKDKQDEIAKKYGFESAKIINENAKRESDKVRWDLGGREIAQYSQVFERGSLKESYAKIKEKENTDERLTQSLPPIYFNSNHGLSGQCWYAK